MPAQGRSPAPGSGGHATPNRDLAVRRFRLRRKENGMQRRAFIGMAAVTALAVWAVAADAQAQKPLHLVLTPSQKPTDLLAAGEEFGATLGKLIGQPVRVTVASDYAAVIEALRNKTADLAFVHPVGYVLAHREAKALIIAKDRWHGNTSYTSRIWVRKDSGLKTLEELRGKTMAFVDPASSSGYVYPMVMLIQRGLVQNRDPKTFFKEVVFSGSHDAALIALLRGHVDAIGSFDQAREQYLKDPAEREKLTWVAESAPIPEGGICGREGLDREVVAKVRDALLKIRGPTYEALLKRLYDIDGFEPAEDREYEVVRAAMDLVGLRPR
jgi:phosphonate transport system substrate-binding protein